MPTSTFRLLGALPIAALLTLTALYGPGSAAAVDDTKPVATCAPVAKDGASDSVEPNTGEKSDSLEIIGAFYKHDPAKAAEATTVNIIVKDLKLELPEANSSMHWASEWNLGDKTYFVRALYDYTSMTVFEWGERIPETAAGALPRYQYMGDTAGKMFEGPEGVVQIVIPADIGGKAGSALSANKVSANAGFQVVPAAATTPSRGLSYEWDNATLVKWTVGPCAAGTPPATPTVTAPGTPTTTPSQTTTTGQLPVKVLTRSVRAKTARKGFAVKLSASEKVTGLVAQLRNSRRQVVAKGKLASLSGKGRLKLKGKRLEKGTYQLDIAGKDSTGARRTTSVRIKVR